MRKAVGTFIAVIMSLSLVACGSKYKNTSETSGSNNSSGTNSSSTTQNDNGTSSDEGKGNSQSSDKNDTSDNNENGSEEVQNRPERNTGNNRNSMEKKIASYLSEIGGPDEISICDADKFDYEPYNEWSFLGGDTWNISGAKIKSADLYASLDKQLIDTCNFQKDNGLLGYVYFKRAGSQKLGITVSCENNDDGSTSTITVYMTHAPECYSAEYIKEQEAIMPDIIPAKTALEILPENYLIEIELNYAFQTLGRKDGNYYCAYKYKEDGQGYSDAYIADSDGSFVKYHCSEYNGDKFSKDGTTSASRMEELLNDWFDSVGYADNGSLSTWGQMSLDFQAGDIWSGNNMRFSISTSLVKTGTENIAGVECAVCKDNNLWTKHEFAYDPATGVMFKIVETENEEEKQLFKVIGYNDSPEGLGTYKQ